MSENSPQDLLTLDVERTSDAVVVHCHGRLVAGATDLFYSKIRPLIPETKTIILDLAGLTRMDSTGLGALVRLYVSAKHVGCSIELTHLGKQVRELLGLTHLLSAFAIIGESGIRMG